MCILCASQEHSSENCHLRTNGKIAENAVFKCYQCAKNNVKDDHRASDYTCPQRLKYAELKNISQKKSGGKNTPGTNFKPAKQPPPLKATFSETLKASSIIVIKLTLFTQRSRHRDRLKCRRQLSIGLVYHRSAVRNIHKCNLRFKAM